MKDEEVKFEEIESSHKLGGVGRSTLLSYTLKYISLTDLDRLSVITTQPVCFAITDTSTVYMR